jgi:hypothetical protein
MTILQSVPSSAIVLASSSRSGSTWLADMLSVALQLQQVFEPLHPRYSATARELTGFDPKQDHVSSFYLRPGHPAPEWDRFLAAILTGQKRNAWTDTVPVVAFPQGYLIKLIRANLLLGYLWDRFQPKLIYLVRHPCAVVYSRLRLRWTANTQALLAQEQLVEDYLRPWVADIERETDAVAAHGLVWAAENLVAQRELAQRPHRRVFYERLMIDPWQEIDAIAEFAGRQANTVSQAEIERLSRTTLRPKTDEAFAGAIAPLVSWTEQLSPAEQQRILDWADRLGIPWYSKDIWPINVPA